MIFKTVTPYIYYAWLIISCGYAIYRGNRPEYMGAAIMITAAIASSIAFLVFETTWTGFDSGIFFIDMILLVALIFLTMISDRFWPIWATAFHLTAVTIHIATMAAPGLAPWALANGYAFLAYPMVMALVIGSHEYVSPRKPKNVKNS